MKHYEYLNKPIDIRGPVTAYSERTIVKRFMDQVGIDSPLKMHYLAAVLIYVSDEKYINTFPKKLLDYPQTARLTLTMLTGDCEDFTRVFNVMLNILGYENYFLAVYFANGGHAVPLWKDGEYWYILNYAVYYRAKELEHVVAALEEQYPKIQSFAYVPAVLKGDGDLYYVTDRETIVKRPPQHGDYEYESHWMEIFQLALKLGEQLNINPPQNPTMSISDFLKRYGPLVALGLIGLLALGGDKK